MLNLALDQPGQQGWAAYSSNWGEQYSDHFYRNIRSRHPDKIAVDAAWPGFNDSAAKWGLNRHMQTRCGKTFDDTLRFYEKYYDSGNSLPFLRIETWNDYQEGTAFERLTFAQCSKAAKALPGVN